MLLNLAGLAVGFYRLLTAQSTEYFTLAVNIGWIIYNLIVLGAACAVAAEEMQKDPLPRVPMRVPCTVRCGDVVEKLFTRDFSRQNIGLESANGLKPGDMVEIEIDGKRFCADVEEFDGQMRCRIVFFGIEDEIAYNSVTFSRRGVWREPEGHRIDEKFWPALKKLFGCSVYGYVSMIEFLPKGIASNLRDWIGSFLPVGVAWESIEERRGNN